MIARHFAGKRLIEVGCGKGYFLELLRQRGHVVTGIDPAYEGENPDVIKAPFTRDLGLSADAVVLRHVLEHIADPLAFLDAIAGANQGGLIYIEVPCLDWILEHRAWFDLFYEHVNYFRLGDLLRCFGSVLEAGHLFNGQYLYIIADLASLRVPSFDGQRLRLPPGFSASLLRGQALVREHGGAARRSGGIVEGSDLLVVPAACRRAGRPCDRHQSGQAGALPAPEWLAGMFAGGGAGGIARGAQILVMNSNYLDEIRHATGNRFVYHAVDDAAFQ